MGTPGSVLRVPEAVERLRAALKPDPRSEPAPGDRLAAVLLAILPGDPFSLVFAKRADGLSRHAGEVSFPGGLVHGEDPDPAAAALREAEEEVALDPSTVEVLGALEPVHTTVSAILIVPFVGLVRGRPILRPDASEIVGVLEYPVDRLLAAETTVTWNLGRHVYEGFAYEMGDHTIWGATAHILQSFLSIVRKETP